MTNEKLTSIYIDTEQLKEFKKNAISRDITMKKLINGFINLFNTNEVFRNDYENLILSGSYNE